LALSFSEFWFGTIKLLQKSVEKLSNSNLIP
jgi:hypothetical protein